jgi:hypothetical protein
VRAAAVEDFLSELKAHGSADLNAVMATLNEGGLCRETLEHWKARGWVEIARSMPLVALRGEHFSRDLTLREFCGEPGAAAVGEPEAPSPEPTAKEEGTNDDHP